MEHTPTPWLTGRGGTIVDVTGRVTASAWVHSSNVQSEDCEATNEANRAFIVRAVNNHDRMVGLLAEAQVELDRLADQVSDVHIECGEKATNIAMRIRSAIAAAAEGRDE